MRLPNLLILTRPLREFITLLLEARGFDEEETEEIRLVATEVVNNSFEHASEKDLHEVEIDMEVDDHKWVFRIRDEGEGRLTQEDFAATDGPPDHLGDRGRGTFLITAFSDEVIVRDGKKGGTEVQITKYRKGKE